MTVIAFDGKSVAADKRATQVGRAITVTKIERMDANRIIGIYGNAGSLSLAREWFKKGQPSVAFDEFSNGDAAYFTIFHRDGTIERYEGTRHAVRFDKQRHYTEGSGRDFAMAALYLGCDARRAVEIAIELSTDCGNGIDLLRFD